MTVGIKKDGVLVTARGNVDLIEGTNITLTVEDATGGDNEVNVTIAGTGGAPVGADYLVGTANPDLTAEIVVGTTPGGELGGTWAVPTVDAMHSGSAHHTQSHVLADGTAIGPDHTMSGAAAGEVLRALSATTAAFDVLAHADLGTVTANQHHNQAHTVADHTNAITVRDEGIGQGDVAIVDFTGGGVTATVAGGVATINVPTGGGATITVQKDDVNVDTAVTTVDFDGDWFEVTSSPAGEANIVGSYPGLIAFAGVGS